MPRERYVLLPAQLPPPDDIGAKIARTHSLAYYQPFVTAVCTGAPSVEAARRRANVPPRTLRDWIESPLFRATLFCAARAALGEARASAVLTALTRYHARVGVYVSDLCNEPTPHDPNHENQEHE